MPVDDGINPLTEKIKEDFKNAGLNADRGVFRPGMFPFVMAVLSEPPFSGFEEKSFDEIKALIPSLKEAETLTLLILWKQHDEVMGIAKSCTSEVRARDFLNTVFSGMGLCRGDSVSATGVVTRSNLLVWAEEHGVEELTEYLKKNALSFYTDTDVVRAGEYSEEHREEILEMPKYKKKRIPWSFVRSTDIALEGTVLRVKSLENESGMLTEAGEDVYIMVGIQGEVYHIDRNKFESTYTATDESFDVFSRMTAFIPEVSILPDEEYVSIDEMAHICYPKEGNRIYAKKIDRRMKVFPEYDAENYFLGNQGDYMAIREDDLSDIYIIRGNIFSDTYEVI